MTRVAAVLVVLALTASAHAEPSSCRGLRALKYAELSSYAQKRFESHPDWVSKPAKAWQDVVIGVIVDRAPHIAREVLAACPGVDIRSAEPMDAKRLTSILMIKVGSFAALSRVLQLPAVRSANIRVPRHFDFEDPL